MKFLECRNKLGIMRFSLDSIRSYGILFIEKNKRTPAHYLLRIELKPVKELDNDSRGVVVEHCKILDLEFETLELAESAVKVIDV